MSIMSKELIELIESITLNKKEKREALKKVKEALRENNTSPETLKRVFTWKIKVKKAALIAKMMLGY